MAASAKLTGGAGHDFQHRIAASHLANLLCRGLAPFVRGGQITIITLEAGSKGWRTDDILLQGIDSANRNFNVATQVKHQCSPIPSDDEFSDFIKRAWDDWNNPAIFNQAKDRLILASSVSSNGLPRFQQLIEAAQSTVTHEEFLRRLGVPKLISKDASTVWDNIKKILPTATEVQLWPFICRCGLAQTDFDVAGGYSESTFQSMLASTCTDEDRARTARETWTDLIDQASRGAGNSREFTYASLPEDLKQRHGAIGGADLDALASLGRDTRRVLDHIETTIRDGAHLSRLEVEAQISDLIKKKRIVLITGPAGSGKSAVAKQVFSALTKDSFGLAFRSEEFSHPTLRATPAFNRISFERVEAVTVPFNQRVVLVESVERLLESISREAFSEFLRELLKDPNVHILLTCRSYSSDIVREAILRPLSSNLQEIEIQPLTDPELTEALAMVPALAAPLQSPQLRRLLRNPFFLKMAAQMKWEGAETLPSVERDFRRKVWREVIERVDRVGGGFPMRRGKTYAACARRRAELLTPYVGVHDLDLEAVEKLVVDGLLVTSPGTPDRVAPAHDVLEDWALLDSLSAEFTARQENLVALVRNEQPFPAMRRALGKWIDEWIEAEPVAAGRSIFEVVSSTEVEQLWRDEALAAVLRSAHASEFISTNQAGLIANKGTLLFRAVHLCRIVATQPNPALSGKLSYLSGTRIPFGVAWPTLIKLLRENHQLVTEGRHEALVANFLEDWSRQITWKFPYPDGCGDAAQICLTEIASDPDSTETRKFCETLVKLPLAHKEAFADLVRSLIKDRHFNRHQPGLPEMMLNGLRCLAVCRDTPDLVIECLQAYLYPPQDDHDVDDVFGTGPSREVEAVFGLRPHLGLQGGQASAYRGPYMHLLNNHPEKAIGLILEMINRAADSYGNREYQGNFEIPDLIEFELPSGEKKQLWASWRLWGAYRGGTVMPHELESALMALEAMLIQRIDLGIEDTEAVLTMILEQANNVALVALVASIACYAPQKAGLAAYSVLTAPQFYEWDLARKVNDPASMEDIGQMFPRLDGEEEIYTAERKSSRQRPHRAKSIEDLCRELQSTPVREKVFALLDRFQADALALGHNDERNVVWLNIVQRMDIRKLRVVEKREDGMVLLQPEPLPEGFNEHIQQLQPGIATSQKILALLHSGMTAFKREFIGATNVEQWKDMLTQSRELTRESRIEEDCSRFLKGAAGYIAAVAVRDHLQELTEDELAWCESEIKSAILEDAETFDDFISAQRDQTAPSRPAGLVIAYLAKSRPSPELNQILATALTHPIDEVRHYAIGSFRGAFSADDPARAQNVLGNYIDAALKYDAESALEKAKPWGQRIDHLVIQKKVFLELRSSISAGTEGNLSNASKLSVRNPSAYKFFPVIANWMVSLGDITPVREFFRANATVLAELYADDEHYQDLYGIGGQALEETLAAHVLQIPVEDAKRLIDPLLVSINTKPDKCARFLELIIEAADRTGDVEKFWPVWNIFAMAVQSTPARRSARHDGILAGIFKGLFMVIDLKEGIERWHLLAGHEQQIVDLFSKLPPSRSTAGLFLTFLRTTGKHVLESGLVAFEKQLKGHEELLTPRNVETLELLLGPPIYSTPARLKADSGVRAAVLAVLDATINAGSTASYFMRNDFATPAAG